MWVPLHALTFFTIFPDSSLKKKIIRGKGNILTSPSIIFKYLQECNGFDNFGVSNFQLSWLSEWPKLTDFPIKMEKGGREAAP